MARRMVLSIGTEDTSKRIRPASSDRERTLMVDVWPKLPVGSQEWMKVSVAPR